MLQRQEKTFVLARTLFPLSRKEKSRNKWKSFWRNISKFFKFHLQAKFEKFRNIAPKWFSLVRRHFNFLEYPFCIGDLNTSRILKKKKKFSKCLNLLYKMIFICSLIFLFLIKIRFPKGVSFPLCCYLSSPRVVTAWGCSPRLPTGQWGSVGKRPVQMH